MKAVKKFAEVGSDKSLILKSLPFPPGSKVEVIVLPAADKEDVFALMDKIVKKRALLILYSYDKLPTIFFPIKEDLSW